MLMISSLLKIGVLFLSVQGLSVWEGVRTFRKNNSPSKPKYSDKRTSRMTNEKQILINFDMTKCKKMKLSQDMQLIQKLRDDQKRMKKVFEVMNLLPIPCEPSWWEIVSGSTFSEAWRLTVNWI
ncbi:hypothetical protein Tco_0880084 [Tanacetum coccineum]